MCALIRDRARSCLQSRLPEGVLISIINRPAFGLVPRKVDVLILPLLYLIHYDNKCIVSVDNSKVHGVGCRNMVSVTFCNTESCSR